MYRETSLNGCQYHELNVQEWQDGNQNLVISDTNPNQTVYVYKCTNSVIQIKGKVNSIILGKYDLITTRL